MNIIGVDPSLTALGIATERAQLVIKPPAAVMVQGYPARMVYLRQQMLSLVVMADLVVIEGIAFMAKGQRRAEICGLGYVLRCALHECGIRYVDVPPSSLKRYATANGNANKQAMVAEAVRRLGYDGSDDNEADALWLRQMALDRYGLPCASMPALNRSALEGVDWPALEVTGAVKHYGEDELPL